jgi:hypothetical protein
VAVQVDHLHVARLRRSHRQSHAVEQAWPSTAATVAASRPTTAPLCKLAY